MNTQNRRAFLRTSTTLALTGLLAACTPAAPSAPTSGGSAGTGTAGSGPALPTYVSVQLPFKPDLPGTGPGIDDAYVNFPAQPFQSVHETPGSGGDITYLTGTFWPPPTPPDQNPMLQAVNKALNATWKLNIVNGADYNAKFNTLIAGQDLPDVFWVGSTPNLVDFLKAQAADLTPYLSGDPIKDYPNLANIPTITWKGTVFGGSIYGLPCPLGAMGNIMQVNKTRWDAEIGADVMPQNADDFKRIAQQLTRPDENKWALASSITDPFGAISGWCAMMYGGPNNWGTVNGKLLNFRETDAFKESIGYLRDLVQLGVFHPKSPTYDSIAAKADHAAGQFVMIQGTFYGNHIDMWNRGAALNPPVKFDLLKPFDASGGKPINWLSAYIWPKNYLGPGIIAFKQASPDRIKELLRIWNWMTAPFGSQERLLLEYGVKDTDYTLDDKGNPIPTQRGPADATFTWGPMHFGAHSPDVLYNAATPDYGPAMQKDEQVMVPEGIPDPTIGAYSNTDGTKGAALNTTFGSGVVDIIAGRRPLSDLDTLVRDWATKGGDQIRSEYEAALQAR